MREWNPGGQARVRQAGRARGLSEAAYYLCDTWRIIREYGIGIRYAIRSEAPSLVISILLHHFSSRGAGNYVGHYHVEDMGP